MTNSDPFAIAFVACLILGMIAIISPIRMLGLTRFRGLLLVLASATFIFLSTDFQHRFFHVSAPVKTAARPVPADSTQNLVAFQKPDQRSNALEFFMNNYPAPEGWTAPDFDKPTFVIPGALFCADKTGFRKIYDMLVDEAKRQKTPNFSCFVLTGNEKLKLISMTSDKQMLEAQIPAPAGAKPKTGWILATGFRN